MGIENRLSKLEQIIKPPPPDGEELLRRSRQLSRMSQRKHEAWLETLTDEELIVLCDAAPWPSWLPAIETLTNEQLERLANGESWPLEER
jgi:hypothetical protein